MNLIQRKLSAGQGVVHVQSTAPTSTHNDESARRARAMLADLAFQYPLKLMSPKISCSDALLAPGLVSIYMLTYGGGLVSGDTIDLDIQVESHCHLVLLTQGNTKVFRERPGGSYNDPPAPRAGSSTRAAVGTIQHMAVQIHPHSSLFLLPAPVTCFERASYSQKQRFHISDPSTSSLLLLDWFTSGRLSRGENWAFDRYRSSNRIYVNGKNLVNDVMLLERSEEIRKRMSIYPCYCTLYIYGRPLSSLLDHFIQITRDDTQFKLARPDQVVWSFSELEPGIGGVVRCAGIETEAVKFWLEKQLAGLKVIIGTDLFKAAFV